MFVNLEAAQGTSYYEMVKLDTAGRRHRRPQDTDIDSFLASTGGGPGGGGGGAQQRPHDGEAMPRAAARR